MTPGREDSRVVALDRATQSLYARVRAAPKNQALWEALEGTRTITPPCVDNVRIVLVPGILYRDFPQTGGDGAIVHQVATKLGIPFEIVPVDGTEGMESAADRITSQLSAFSESDHVLLFSLSKGSAEVRHALCRRDAGRAFRRVRAWISVSGLPFGTPTAETVFRRPLAHAWISVYFWLRRWKLRHVRDLLYHRPDASFEIPPHLQFVQIAAFPLHGQLRDRRSRRFQKRLADFGPNDGFALLAELAALPGALYPVWGADHYLRGCPELSATVTRLIEHLSRSPQPSSSA